MKQFFGKSARYIDKPAPYVKINKYGGYSMNLDCLNTRNKFLAGLAKINRISLLGSRELGTSGLNKIEAKRERDSSAEDL